MFTFLLCCPPLPESLSFELNLNRVDRPLFPQPGIDLIAEIVHFLGRT